MAGSVPAIIVSGVICVRIPPIIVVYVWVRIIAGIRIRVVIVVIGIVIVRIIVSIWVPQI